MDKLCLIRTIAQMQMCKHLPCKTTKIDLHKHLNERIQAFFVCFMTLDYYEISQNLSFSILDPEFFWLHPEFFGVQPEFFLKS